MAHFHLPRLAHAVRTLTSVLIAQVYLRNSSDYKFIFSVSEYTIAIIKYHSSQCREVVALDRNCYIATTPGKVLAW
jgi:hypothetical protein